MFLLPLISVFTTLSRFDSGTTERKYVVRITYDIVRHNVWYVQDEEEDEEDEESLGQETLLTARQSHAPEFSAGRLPQYTEDTLIIHGDEV